MTQARNRWYKDKVFYQIWMRSFSDGNGDGIGDLWGVLGKLDYVKSLGVDGIWFNPLYPSPNADFGYDVADYKSINPEFGDLDLFKRVLDGAHERGLKVIMDLVINHTSIEHPWFKASRRADSPYHDYYFWRRGKGPDEPPNNWDSLFGGRAWEYDPGVGEWYLHLFDKRQADLNLDNPRVRDEIKDIMRFWLDLGVDGFREDVITYISKETGLPDDMVSPAGSRGALHYNRGPHYLDYLREFRHDVLDRYDCMTVGECPAIEPPDALRIVTEGKDQALDLVFHFQHMEADYQDNEFEPCPFDLKKLKSAFSIWQLALADAAWDALFMENHDRPRIISRYGSERYHDESGKMLATCYLFQRGTPFVYQGQEIGMTNISFGTIDEYNDTDSIGHYHDLRKTMGDAEAMEIIRHASRDSARTPMQWTAGPNAGFSEGTPWFAVNPNHREINVEAQEGDPDSLLNFYRKAIALRKRLSVVRDGSYREICPESTDFFAYERDSGDQRLLVVCSFSEGPASFSAPRSFALSDARLMLCNYPDAPLRGNGFSARPFEARVYLLRG